MAHVVRLVEDIEPVNLWMWVDRVRPLIQLLKKFDYPPPRDIRVPKPHVEQALLPTFPPHWVRDDEANTNSAP